MKKFGVYCGKTKVFERALLSFFMKREGLKYGRTSRYIKNNRRRKY